METRNGKYCFFLSGQVQKPGHQKMFRLLLSEIFESKAIRKGLRGCLLDTGMILNNEFRPRVKLTLHSDDKIDRLSLRR